MSKYKSATISRKARIWPEMPKETVTLPSAPMLPNPPQFSMLMTVIFSLVGMGIYAYIFSRIGTGNSVLLIIPLVAMSGMMALSSLMTLVLNSINTRRRTRYLLKLYYKKLQESERQLQIVHWKERQARCDLNPPFIVSKTLPICYKQLAITPLVQRSFNEQDIHLWARRPNDPDFLEVRIGMGTHPITFKVRANLLDNTTVLPNKLEQYKEYARSLLEKYASLTAPLTVKLAEHSSVAITSSQQRLVQARELAHVLVAQLAYHHSPEDVRIIVLAPQSQAAEWQWAATLPHTVLYDPRQSGENTDEAQLTHAVAIGTGAVSDQLPAISREVGRRELLLGDVRQTTKTPILPRLVIIVDHFDPAEDLDQPTLLLSAVSPGQADIATSHHPHLSVTPLKRPEMTLALSRGTQLGVSVLCVNANKADVPTTSGMLIDLDVIPPPDILIAATTRLPTVEHATRFKFRKPRFKHKDTGRISEQLSGPLEPQAYIRTLQPDPPPMVACELLDRAPIEVLHYFAQRMHLLHAVNPKRLEIRTQVDIRTLFEPPLDLANYDPYIRWNDPLYRSSSRTKGSVPLMRIPIGLKIGDEVQYLDLLKDGPHGLLIGQTGSGKSELLQTIIMALAVAYRPTEVTFLLIDYKAGLALEPFRTLPHTIGFLSNVSSPALIQRFITMLRAEATRREIRLKEGLPTPRLVIIIDEFAEMAKRTEAVLDELFTITRVGREIGMHLLLAAQRPEGVIGSKVRDYVQYRLCLRCASPEDSREVLRRVDAASLPASIPGRGYLLHGDNQLDLFQAARATLPIQQEHIHPLNGQGHVSARHVKVQSVSSMEKDLYAYTADTFK